MKSPFGFVHVFVMRLNTPIKVFQSYHNGTTFSGQGSHRLEKYLKMKGCLEKYLKTKFALKSAGKLAIGLEKHLNFTSSGIPDNKIRFQNQM